MLAAFRANVDFDLASGRFAWKIPLDELLPVVISDLVRICVSEHRDNRLTPDQVGKRESTLCAMLRQGCAVPSGRDRE
jgi:hypothetical protein